MINNNHRASQISSTLFTQNIKIRPAAPHKVVIVMLILQYIDELQDYKCRRSNGGCPPLQMDFLQRVGIFWSTSMILL